MKMIGFKYDTNMVTQKYTSALVRFKYTELKTLLFIYSGVGNG